jgi:Spy/CpxP family protein refolding chaperone
MKRIALITLLGVASAIAPLAAAQTSVGNAAQSAADFTDLSKLREEAKADKHALVADTLRLTDPEAKRFWPIYDTYQRTLDETSRRRVLALEGLMFREKKMTNLAAKRLVTELMAIDDAEAKARRTLRNRLMRSLPPIKVARYLQLEDKIQAIRDYDIAASVPLVH